MYVNLDKILLKKKNKQHCISIPNGDCVCIKEVKPENAEYEITADFIKSTKQSNTILNDCIAVFKKTGNKYESFGIYYKSCTETEIPIWYNSEQSLAYLQAKINNLINGIL